MDYQRQLDPENCSKKKEIITIQLQDSVSFLEQFVFCKEIVSANNSLLLADNSLSLKERENYLILKPRHWPHLIAGKLIITEEIVQATGLIPFYLPDKRGSDATRHVRNT